MTIAITIILLMKYLSLAGGDEAGEEQFTSSISPTLTMVIIMIMTMIRTAYTQNTNGGFTYW